MRKAFAGIFLKLFQLIAVIGDAYVIRFIKIKQILQEAVSVDLFGNTIGKRGGDAVEFVMSKDQRSVIKHVTRRVDRNRDVGGTAIKGDGEETERCADAEFAIDKVSLYKRIADIQIVLTLVAHVSNVFADQRCQIAVTLAGGIVAREVLGSDVSDRYGRACLKKNIKRVVDTGCIKEIYRVFWRKTGKE